MEAELTALAAAGATALVQHMAVESWTQARDRMVSFFSRRGGEEDVVEAELETSREELAAALRTGDDQTASDVRAEWRTRLRRTLLAHPTAASDLREVLDELDATGEGQRATGVRNTISGGVQHGPVVQAGTVGPLSFGTPSGHT